VSFLPLAPNAGDDLTGRGKPDKRGLRGLVDEERERQVD
jgi:hypothetical protein